MKLNTIIILLLVSCGFIYSCSTSNTNGGYNYVKPYKAALHSTKELSTAERAILNLGINRFTSAFEDLTSADTAGQLTKLYSDNIYFNDTFKTFTQKDELLNYLVATTEHLISSEVHFSSPLISEHDVYIPWIMNIEFEVLGKTVLSESIGITQLRFDENAQITMHQDYWDSSYGFYRHLPFLGFFINKARNSL